MSEALGKSFSCEDVSKVFKTGNSQLPVLDGLSFSVEPSKLNVICGSSGSGKSTLLHVLGGIDRPSSGRVLWEGRSIYGFGADELARWRALNVGFVFQAYHLLPELSVLENVMLPARILRREKRQTLAQAKELIERVGLSSRVKHRPMELSGGERQRAAIARALVNSPKVILADEPTGNLDAENGERVMQLFLDLQRERQLTTVLVTHDEKIAIKGDVRYSLCEGKLGKVS